jgi:hypothetical protein
MDCLYQFLLLFSGHKSDINTPCVCMYYMFRPIAAIIRYTEPLQSSFLLSAIPPCTGQCLHIGSALYWHIVSVTSRRYKMYQTLIFKLLQI